MSADPVAHPPSGAFYLRAATAADAPAIRRMVHEAGINPLSLHWQNFVVAEDALRPEKTIVGIGQVKQHYDGSRELASIAVQPELQGIGIGGAIIRALMARERGPLYLTCRDGLAGYYARFGFCRATAGLPPYFRHIARLTRAVLAAARVFNPRAPGSAVMLWPCRDEPPAVR